MKNFFKGSMLLALASVGLAIVKGIIDSRQDDLRFEEKFNELYDKRVGLLEDKED